MVRVFFEGLRRLSLGIVLLAIAGMVLLLLDLQSRKGARNSGPGAAIPRIAFVQHASIKAIDDGRVGAIEQLKKRGYIDGETVSIKYFNAEGDIGTANAIAKEVTSGSYDFILTMSTPSLQTVASANKSAGQITHVFGLVTDPYSAGVGIDREDHLKHPPYMTGMGSMQPIESILRYIKEMRPEARRIGLVWNPAESNSAAQTLLARALCKEMSLELIEGSVENSAAVQEATNSVLSRGVDCMWISGDITVSSANTLVIRAASNAGVPVFCSLPSAVLLGSTLDLGADYISIGRTLGDMAADVIGGKKPADIPVENRTDEILLYNDTTLSKLKERWTITPSIRKRANGWITETEKNIPAHLMPSK
ncbi:MAG: ABC transporter substrate-binding protein [Pirellula sp.]